MSVEENNAIARKHFEEVWNKGRVKLMDEYYRLDLPPSDFNNIDHRR